MNGVPDARAPVSARLEPGAVGVVDELERQQERHGQRRARGERRDLAQRGRDRVLGEVHADAGGGDDRRLAGIEAGGGQLAPTRTRPPRSRPARAAASRGRRSRARSGAAASRPEDRAGRPRTPAGAAAISGRRWAKVSRPAPRMTYWPTPRPACSATRSSMKRARATMAARKPAGAVRVHVRAVAPAVVGRRQPQADLVLEHVRRRIDLDVHRPPQGDPHRGAVRRRGLLVCHDAISHVVLAGAWRLHRRPSGSRTVISRVP